MQIIDLTKTEVTKITIIRCQNREERERIVQYLVSNGFITKSMFESGADFHALLTTDYGYCIELLDANGNHDLMKHFINEECL